MPYRLWFLCARRMLFRFFQVQEFRGRRMKKHRAKRLAMPVQSRTSRHWRLSRTSGTMTDSHGRQTTTGNDATIRALQQRPGLAGVVTAWRTVLQRILAETEAQFAGMRTGWSNFPASVYFVDSQAKPELPRGNGFYSRRIADVS